MKIVSIIRERTRERLGGLVQRRITGPSDSGHEVVLIHPVQLARMLHEVIG
jgi:hypothetical protein